MDVNNLCLWEMSQKLSVDGFRWINDKYNFDEMLIKSYDGNSDRGHIPEVNLQYPKNRHDSHRDLTFLPERIKTKKKGKYVIHKKNFKQALSHDGLVLKKVHKVIEFNQKEQNDFEKTRTK